MVAAALLAAFATAAHADPVKCQRAIAKASSQLAQAEMALVTKCEQSKLHGALPGTTDCSTEPKTAAAVDKARGKLQSVIARACGGANKSCAADDGGADADDSLAAIGWDLGTCPGFEGLPCANPIADCDDIATCIACVTDGAVDQATALYYDGFTPAAAGSALGKCQAAIGKEAAKFFAAEAKALQKCEDQVLQGKIAGPCPDGNAQFTIAKAEAQKASRICSACGGSDHACGRADDLSPTTIGFLTSCPSVTVPGGSSCGESITSTQELVDCVDCVTSFKGSCLDALAVPGLKPYPQSCALVATPTPTSTPTTTQTPSPSPTPPAGPAAVGCERVLVKEASRFVQTKIKRLGDCERAKLTGKVPPTTDCPHDPKVVDALTKASTRLTGHIAKSCGGANRTCDALDAGADADETLPEIGWPVSACPNFENGACAGPVADCGDVGTCIACVAEAAVEQAVAFYFDVIPADPSTPDGKCQLAIGKAATSFYTARALALAKCAGSALAKGTEAACPDAKATSTIAKAEDKLIKTMCKACGGADGLCGGGDDIAPSELGLPSTCPAVTVPGGNPCGGPIDDLGALVACVACLTDFKSECTDRIAIPGSGYAPECNLVNPPTPTPLGTPGPTATPVCGDGVKQSGEDCDDGNSVNCDACPKDCKTSHAPVQCASTTARHAQSIHLVPPPGALLSAGVFCIDYPAGVVALPGTGNVPTSGRVSGISAISSLNDFNNAVQFGFVANPAFTDVTPVISFDLCTGAAAPVPTDFSCVVKNASNQGDSIDPPSLVECTPVAP
jgi:cysteine-rich repeat protein